MPSYRAVLKFAAYGLLYNTLLPGGDGFIPGGDYACQPYAVVTPWRKAASYDPRIATLGIWG